VKKATLAQARLIPRRSLRAETDLTGPLIITENDATTYIPTGWQGQLAPGGYLRIKKHA